VRTSRPTPHRKATRRLLSAAPLPLGTLGLVLWFIAVRRSDFSHIGQLGLVTILGWTFFAGLGLLVSGLSLELVRTPLRPHHLMILVIGLVIMLFGTASAVEPTARLVDSWVHAGFVQYIFVHGHVLNGYDARFSWPGGFSLGAVLVGFTGQTNALDFLRWAPLVFELLYLPPLLVIAKSSGVGRRAGWLGVTLFYVANWTDQDYFSPQALNLFFFLVVVATVLAAWKPKGLSQSGGHGAGLRARIAQIRAGFTLRRMAGHDTVATWNGTLTVGVLGLLLLVCLASAISHQITPYALVLALAGCLLTRRLGRPELVVVVAVLAVGWLSLGASDFWVGHLSQIFGSVGRIGSTLGSNVTSRVTGSASHRLVVDLRILLTAALFGLAVIGSLRRATETRTLEFLVGSPFLLLAFQNYGGEVLIRVVLFGLPFTSLLAASAILPNRSGAVAPLIPRIRRRLRAPAVLGLTVAVTLFGFALLTTVVRGGNDAYEAFSIGELQAVNFAYDHVQPRQSIGLVAPYLPVGQRDVGSVNVFVADDGPTVFTLRHDASALLRAQPEWIILSQSQEAWGETVAGFARGWERSIENDLIRNGYRVAARWSTATVLHAGAGT
jgi:hypothetical protein